MYDIQTDKQFPNELVVISGLRLSTKLFVFKIQLAWKYSWVDNIKICTETSNTSLSAETKIVITSPSKYDYRNSEIKMIFLNNNFRNNFFGMSQMIFATSAPDTVSAATWYQRTPNQYKSDKAVAGSWAGIKERGPNLPTGQKTSKARTSRDD